MKEKVVLIGNGGHAKVILDILEAVGQYQVIGVTTAKVDSQDSFCGYPVLGGDGILPGLIKQGVKKAVIGVGGFRDNSLRTKVYERVKAAGFELVSAIHPSAIISKTVVLGEANVIFPGVVINSHVRIGHNVIIATGSTIDHDVLIEDHVLVSAGVTVGANITIKEGALLALGSKVVSDIRIGRGALVAAGAVVVKDVEDETVVFGVPARPKEKTQTIK